MKIGIQAFRIAAPSIEHQVSGWGQPAGTKGIARAKLQHVFSRLRYFVDEGAGKSKWTPYLPEGLRNAPIPLLTST